MEIFMLSSCQVAANYGHLRALLVKQYQLLPRFVMVKFTLGVKMVTCMSLDPEVMPRSQQKTFRFGISEVG